MNFIELAAARHSVRKYETGVTIDDAELTRIFDTVILSPSSYNVQHWQFVVVRDEARKRELSALSFGQPQVADAAAVVLVCGRLDAFEDAPRIYAELDQETREKSVGRILGAYTDAPVLQREEAIRSGSLAAMSLMYAAKALGWDSGPMIGFEADKVSAFLNLDAQTIPVMMIVVGKALNGEQPARAYRRPLSEVVKLETLDGASLGAPA